MMNKNPSPCVSRVAGMVLLLLLPFFGKGQVVVGNWNFNGILTGTPGTNNTVSAASLGSSILSSNYNGGTVFFGEGGWPTGGLNLNAYLQFSLTPNAGYSLNLASIDFNIRRSTTGTPAGSGPQTWALRSNLDGYSSNISSGVLTQNTTPTITVTLGAPFNMLNSAVIFRLYGYNSVTTSGGLDRFVYDNITARGLLVLPISITDFSGNFLTQESIQIKGNIYHSSYPVEVYIQRSVDAIQFSSIDSLSLAEGDDRFTYIDHNIPKTSNLYYRIAIGEKQGGRTYSSIVSIKTAEDPGFEISRIIESGGKITVQINAPKKTSAHLVLISVTGNILQIKNIILEKGLQWLELESENSRGI